MRLLLLMSFFFSFGCAQVIPNVNVFNGCPNTKIQVRNARGEAQGRPLLTGESVSIQMNSYNQQQTFLADVFAPSGPPVRYSRVFYADTYAYRNGVTYPSGASNTPNGYDWSFTMSDGYSRDRNACVPNFGSYGGSAWFTGPAPRTRINTGRPAW